MTSVHSWNDTRIFIKEARSGAAAGHEVAVIAQRQTDDVIDGVHCLGIPRWASRLKRMMVGPRYIFVRARHFEVCHFHDPELIPVGLLLKLFGKRVVYDVHEDLPRQMADKFWIPSWLRKFMGGSAEAIEWLAARAFDSIVAATPTIAARFPQSKTVLVQNYPIAGELVLSEANDYSARAPFFAYVGELSRERGAVTMVDALALLADREQAALVIAGTCSPPSLLAELKARPGWPRVDFRGQTDRAAVARLLAGCRAGLVLFHPAPNHVEAQPNKLFEYMSAGLPVIASNFPLWRQIIADGPLGLVVDPESPQAIADALRWILDNPIEAAAMGRRGQDAVRDKYNWSSEARKLLAMYDSLR